MTSFIALSVYLFIENRLSHTVWNGQFSSLPFCQHKIQTEQNQHYRPVDTTYEPLFCQFYNG